jgi:hypothetical protein
MPLKKRHRKGPKSDSSTEAITIEQQQDGIFLVSNGNDFVKQDYQADSSKLPDEKVLIKDLKGHQGFLKYTINL